MLGEMGFEGLGEVSWVTGAHTRRFGPCRVYPGAVWDQTCRGSWDKPWRSEIGVVNRNNRQWGRREDRWCLGKWSCCPLAPNGLVTFTAL